MGLTTPIIQPRLTASYENTKDVSRARNPSNLVNWLESVQQFYARLAEDDWKALSIAAFSVAIGALPTTDYLARMSSTFRELAAIQPPDRQPRCEDRATDELKFQIHKFHIHPLRAPTQPPASSSSSGEGVPAEEGCEDEYVWPAFELVRRGKTIEDIVQRARRLLDHAPKLQDDLEVFYALPSAAITTSTAAPNVAIGELPREYVVPFRAGAFVPLDTAPQRAMARLLAGVVDSGLPRHPSNNSSRASSLSSSSAPRRPEFKSSFGLASALVEAAAPTPFPELLPGAPTIAGVPARPTVLLGASRAPTPAMPIAPSTANLGGAGLDEDSLDRNVEGARDWTVIPWAERIVASTNVVRIRIRAGTPALPLVIPSAPWMHDNLASVLPLVFAPGAFLSPIPAERAEAVAITAGGEVEWQRIQFLDLIPPNRALPLEVPEAKTGRPPVVVLGLSGWPPLPFYNVQPPVQSFVDVPLALNIGARTHPSCSPVGWLPLLDEVLRSKGVRPTACHAPETWADVHNYQLRLLRSQNAPNRWTHAAELASLDGLVLINPDDEPLVPPQLRDKLLWYRSASVAVPAPLRVLQEPCRLPFTIVPLGLVAVETPAKQSAEASNAASVPPETMASNAANVGREMMVGSDGLTLTSHRNYLLVDHVRRRVERYEPHGGVTGAEELNFADRVLPIVLARLGVPYRYDPPSSFCPVLPKEFRGIQAVASEKEVGAEGYCECYANMYLMLRLLNPSWSPEQIKVQMNRAGASNLVVALPRITDGIFPPPVIQRSHWRLLATVTRAALGMQLVRYVQMFNLWTDSLRELRLALLPANLPPTSTRSIQAPSASLRPPSTVPLSRSFAALPIAQSPSALPFPISYAAPNRASDSSGSALGGAADATSRDNVPRETGGSSSRGTRRRAHRFVLLSSAR